MARRPRITGSISTGTEVYHSLERERLEDRGRSDDAIRVAGAGRSSDRGHCGEAINTPADSGVPLDAAIDATLTAEGVDAVTRVRLSVARRAIVEGMASQAADGFEGRGLSRALFRFVMPRLRHPQVLRADRHRALLEDLASGLAEDGGDVVVREGALVVHRELRRLALLRAGRNALVEG